MTQKDTKKPEAATKSAPAPARPESRDEAAKQPALDFAKLDLTIEKVEERISPSETNVFDK